MDVPVSPGEEARLANRQLLWLVATLPLSSLHWGLPAAQPDRLVVAP